VFYGQIIKQKYLKDPSISFCGIGDARSDTAPLQVTTFAQGKQIDELISKIWLEGGGGEMELNLMNLLLIFGQENVTSPLPPNLLSFSQEMKEFMKPFSQKDFKKNLNLTKRKTFQQKKFSKN
jgi:hypothetical protein